MLKETKMEETTEIATAAVGLDLLTACGQYTHECIIHGLPVHTIIYYSMYIATIQMFCSDGKPTGEYHYYYCPIIIYMSLQGNIYNVYSPLQCLIYIPNALVCNHIN